MVFGIQLPQINIPFNLNPVYAVQNAATSVQNAAQGAVNGAGSIVSSDVTQLYNIGRNVETNYVSPVIATGAQGANRVITAGNNVAALPGNAFKGAETSIFNFGNAVSTDVNSFLAGPGNALTQQEKNAGDFFTQQEKQAQDMFNQDMKAVDDTFNKFFSGLTGVVAPVATAGTDITKYIIIGVLGLALVVVFLLFYSMKPGGHKRHRSG